MYCIEEFRAKYGRGQTETHIDGKWVLARPLNYKCRRLRERLSEAWAVFTGRAEAMVFYGQEEKQ